MFKSREAVSSLYENTHQTISNEVKDGFLEQHVNDLRTPPSALQHPATESDLDRAALSEDGTADPDVMVQIETAKRYPDEPCAFPEESPSEVENPDATRLYIGSGIKLKGSLEACGFLHIDGHLEASVQSKELSVAEFGTFIGDAVVDNAEVCGRVEGKLTVKNKLVIRAAGVVAGTIEYGSIEIESGGLISGDVQALPRNETQIELGAPGLSAVPETPVPRPEPQSTGVTNGAVNQ